MGKRITVLVSGASGIVGYGCLRSLNQNKEIRLIGTSIYESMIAASFCDVFEKAVHTEDTGYLEWLLHIIKKHEVDLLIPGIEIDMFHWNKNRERIESSGACLMLNRKGLIELCGDKWHFYQKLKENIPELAIPSFLEIDYDELVQSAGTPFLLKPRKGYGAKGIVSVDTKQDYEFYCHKFRDTVMAQKRICGEEFTVGAFFDNNSAMCASISMKRKLSTGGFTETAEVVEPKEMKYMLERLADVFQPIGPTNFQFIKDGEQWRLLEINPRISSSTSLRTAFHYNECRMSVEYYLNGQAPGQPALRKGTAARYMEDIVKYDRCNF